MNDMTLEKKVEALAKEVKGLKKKIEDKEARLMQAEDYIAICNLQCAYGFYLQHWMKQEIMDCFAMDHPEVSATLVEGTYNGPEGVRRYFGKSNKLPDGFLHLILQVNPVITFNKDCTRAYGRWFGYGTVFSQYHEAMDPSMTSVIYEMEYIKQNGIWKILKLALTMEYSYNRGTIKQGPPPGYEVDLTPDIWAPYNTQYPSDYIYPFSFKHPVTGKTSTEAARNAKLDLKPSPYLPEKK